MEEKGPASQSYDDSFTLRYPESSDVLGENAYLGPEDGQSNLILAAWILWLVVILTRNSEYIQIIH